MEKERGDVTSPGKPVGCGESPGGERSLLRVGGRKPRRGKDDPRGERRRRKPFTARVKGKVGTRGVLRNFGCAHRKKGRKLLSGGNKSFPMWSISLCTEKKRKKGSLFICGGGAEDSRLGSVVASQKGREEEHFFTRRERKGGTWHYRRSR